MQRVAIVSQAASREAFQALLECTYQLNCLYLANCPDTPRLYDSGVVFEPEDRECSDGTCKEERFCTIPIVLAARKGDCDDLAPWRAAELTVRDGIVSIPLIVPVGPRSWHVFVQRSDGVWEDPSAVLGMHEYNARRRFNKQRRVSP